MISIATVLVGAAEGFAGRPADLRHGSDVDVVFSGDRSRVFVYRRRSLPRLLVPFVDCGESTRLCREERLDWIVVTDAVGEFSTA